MIQPIKDNLTLWQSFIECLKVIGFVVLSFAFILFIINACTYMRSILL
jgi:hypothetical protein